MRTLGIAVLMTIAALAANAQTKQSPAKLDFSPSGIVNKKLPKWIQFGGEYRARFEGYSGGSFKPDTTDSYMLSRLRLNMTLKPTSWLTFYGEGADMRAFAKSPALPPFQNTWDIRQAYAEIGGGEKQPVGLKVGRQELDFGETRLIGSLPWVNNMRVFDAVRGTYKANGVRIDAFVSSVVNPVDGTWDHHLQGNNLHGVYGSFEKLIPKATVEAYELWRLQPRVKNEAGVVANVDEKVTGVRWVGKLPMGFDYGTELVNEAGGLGSDKIRAWAGHWVFGLTPAKVKFAPRFFVETNFASGDKNSKDGVRGTFDQLYPTGHDKYGLSDQMGWKNMKDLKLGVQTKPVKKVTASFVYNNMYLDSPFDALYNSAGTAVAKSATGTAGTHVGQELDVLGTFAMSKTLTAGAGFAHLMPGEFLKNTTPGQAYNYPYLMFTWKF